MLRISTGLKQKSWDAKLRSESRTADVFEDFQGTIPSNKPRLPSGIIAHQTLAPGKNTHVIGLIKNLSGAGVTGRTDQIGNEVDDDTRQIEVYSNDVSQAVNTERYGIDAHDKAVYGIIEGVQPRLSIWHKEMDGKYCREAIVERYSTNLVAAPTSLTKRWNENILVTGVALSAQPAYNVTNATYEEAIGDAITTMSSSTWDVALLNAIQYWASVTKKLETMDNGRYIVLVPSRQAVLLKDPSSSTSISGLFKDSHVMEAAKNSYRQYLGTWGNLDLFEDTRNPIIALTGSNASWDIAAYYKGAGDDDDRTGLTGTLVDVGMVFGKGAVIRAQHEALHFEQEIQNYKKVIGVGAFCGYGYNRTVYDAQTPATASVINQNSGLIFTANSAITA